ncbi:transposase [Micromonospora lutea]|uniref:transposase n=1 Tax=Micromonospora lutea TaxID=419825 RepID=UPI00402B9BB3
MRSSVTKPRSRRGGGRFGRRENGSGAAAGVAGLRRRGRSNAASTEGTHLGPTRSHPGGPGVGQGLRPRLDRRADLLPARPAAPVDLPHDRAPRPQKRTTQLQRMRLHQLLDAAHQQLDGPIVLIWDNLNTHISAAMRAMIDARDWLTVIRLPAYAPDLNPTEAVWSHLKRSIGNLAVTGVDHLLAIIKNRLKSIQYRTDLLDGFLAHTGLTLEPDTT